MEPFIPPKTATYIWQSGALVPFEKAVVHVSAHALHYGSSIFEGIRCYQTPRGPAIFRLGEHMDRLMTSAKLMRMAPLPWSRDELFQACVELVRANNHQACYLRPLVFRGAGPLGVHPQHGRIEATIQSMEWGTYLGAGALEAGVDVAVSSWRRISAGELMPQAKVGGQYVNSLLAANEAKSGGFSEAILLDRDGYLTEGAGQNIFLVIRGELWTPADANSILLGITRDSVQQIARDLGLNVRQEQISRDMLYLADEIFLTGTASEMTPVRSVDRLPVGSGKPGPLTARLQEEFFKIVRGEVDDRHGWLTIV
jgi:branched-chain amino acid aminotransferase